MIKALLSVVTLCLAMAPVLGEPSGAAVYTEGGYFSVVMPGGWIKKEAEFGLSSGEKKVYGVEFVGPVSGGLTAKISVHYYAPGNLLHKTPERFVKLHSQPAIGINLDGKVYSKVTDGRVGNFFARIFSRKVFEYMPSNVVDPEKILVYESFAVVPLKNGFFVLRYYAPADIAKANLMAYETILNSFKPLIR